jgi:hypothetical protein
MDGWRNNVGRLFSSNGSQYQCWEVAVVLPGVMVRCCDECHESGAGSYVSMADGTTRFVCCSTRIAYDDYYQELHVKDNHVY